MSVIDLKRTYREHYDAAPDPEIVDVPERPYLMIDGSGDPNTSHEYADAVKALYSLAYGLRAAIKAATGTAYRVMPLEGLWWADDMATFSVDRKGDWRWTLLMLVPEAGVAIFPDVQPSVTEKKRLALGHQVRLRQFGDGRAAQILHLGPYAAETPTIEKLHAFIHEQGLRMRGTHHEIYLSDPRRVDPAKMRTIIRQPVL